MERNYKPLQSAKAPEHLSYHQPTTFTNVTVDSPALCVMTDLRQISAATIAPEAHLHEATKTMIFRGVRMLLVVDVNDEVVGLITARDTLGDRPVTVGNERGYKHAELRVSDIMTRRDEMDTLDVADVLTARVGHIISSLKAWGRQHALVCDKDPVTGQARIRGVFSATQIGRQLGVPLQTFEVANTFADIEKAVVGA